MKKTFIMLLAIIMAVNVNAQLRVDSLGRMKVGNNNATNTNGYSATIGSTRNTGALLIHNNNHNSSQYGIGINWQSSYAYPMAINAQSQSMNGASWITGIRGEVYGGSSTSSHKSIGIFGCVEPDLLTSFTTGVFGSNTHYAVPPSSGMYAGYFQGDVCSTGVIYGTILNPSSASSPSNGGSTSVVTVRDDEVSITDKLKQVDLLQMERVNQNGSLAANQLEKEVDADVLAMYADDLAKDGTGDIKEILEKNIQTRLSSVSYGLAADQLKEVYPELVYQDKEGNYSINYIEMVPLLVQGIKELSAEVTTLKQQLGLSDADKPIQKAKGKTTAVSDEDIEVVSMSQNKPNPFSSSSVITLSIPQETKQATIGIYDMSGKQMQSIAVPERGETNITVHAAGLTPGMYIYNLVADGKVRATRKMIVTE